MFSNRIALPLVTMYRYFTKSQEQEQEQQQQQQQFTDF